MTRAEFVDRLLKRVSLTRDELMIIATDLREAEATASQQQEVARLINRLLEPARIGRPRVDISEDLEKVVSIEQLRSF